MLLLSGRDQRGWYFIVTPFCNHIFIIDCGKWNQPGWDNLPFGLPYSGKFSRGAKFCFFRGQVDVRKNINHVDMTSLLERRMHRGRG